MVGVGEVAGQGHEAAVARIEHGGGGGELVGVRASVTTDQPSVQQPLDVRPAPVLASLR